MVEVEETTQSEKVTLSKVEQYLGPLFEVSVDFIEGAVIVHLRYGGHNWSAKYDRDLLDRMEKSYDGITVGALLLDEVIAQVVRQHEQYPGSE